jgi:mono/diheme cytochrome c family protein
MFAAYGAVACSTRETWVKPEPSLERMLAPPRATAFGPSAVFDDGAAMRTPPDGTVPIERGTDRVVTTGVERDAYVEQVPLPMTRALLETGRARFRVVCAACHGILGSGESPVADNMRVRRPRSLHDPEVRAFTAGKLFRTISQGYGLMPSYAAELDVRERWAVVAYVKALELSQNALVAELPAELRAALAKEAP